MLIDVHWFLSAGVASKSITPTCAGVMSLFTVAERDGRVIGLLLVENASVTAGASASAAADGLPSRLPAQREREQHGHDRARKEDAAPTAELMCPRGGIVSFEDERDAADAGVVGGDRTEVVPASAERAGCKRNDHGEEPAAPIV